jgi:phosphate starvation-inducible protein PhoH
MARKKTLTKKDKELKFFSEINHANIKAITDGPKKKTFSLHDLRSIRPMNEAQRDFFESYLTGNNVIGNGSAGTGKSYISLFLALNDILDESKLQEKIIIVRSAVPSREVGHLPGDMKEKMAVYEEPYKDIVGNLMRGRNSYNDLKDAGKIEFMSTSFVRGLTWDNAVVVIDEAQSCTFHELNSVITRLGNNSKLVICGDIAQNDLITKRNDLSGFIKMLKIASRMDEFDIINFTRNDICRSAFVKSWICASEDTDE